jgi:hypothetical protein
MSYDNIVDAWIAELARGASHESQRPGARPDRSEELRPEQLAAAPHADGPLLVPVDWRSQ